MLEIEFTGRFRKDLKLLEKRRKDLKNLHHVIVFLQHQNILEAKYRNHKLIGNYVGSWECHIEPDWLLIYTVQDNTLFMQSSGTHSDCLIESNRLVKPEEEA